MYSVYLVSIEISILKSGKKQYGIIKSKYQRHAKRNLYIFT